jgi:hypothetical protein
VLLQNRFQDMFSAFKVAVCLTNAPSKILALEQSQDKLFLGTIDGTILIYKLDVIAGQETPRFTMIGKKVLPRGKKPVIQIKVAEEIDRGFVVNGMHDGSSIPFPLLEVEKQSSIAYIILSFYSLHSSLRSSSSSPLLFLFISLSMSIPILFLPSWYCTDGTIDMFVVSSLEMVPSNAVNWPRGITGLHWDRNSLFVFAKKKIYQVDPRKQFRFLKVVPSLFFLLSLPFFFYHSFYISSFLLSFFFFFFFFFYSFFKTLLTYLEYLQLSPSSFFLSL